MVRGSTQEISRANYLRNGATLTGAYCGTLLDRFENEWMYKITLLHSVVTGAGEANTGLPRQPAQATSPSKVLSGCNKLLFSGPKLELVISYCGLLDPYKLVTPARTSRKQPRCASSETTVLEATTRIVPSNATARIVPSIGAATPVRSL